jgi:DNA (cytosine-5)-methyltransferase 1
MVEYTCETCKKVFKQKGHLKAHMNRQRSCKPDDTIERIVKQKVDEVLSNLKIDSLLHSSQLSNTMNTMEMPTTKLRMVDLFAGTGAFTHAFEQTGKVSCVFANDMVESSKKIYDENFTHKLTLKNLNDIDVDEIPPHDILTGGFPCQPFSIAGRQKGFEDERSNVFFKILAILDKHNPRCVILENVKNLLTHGKPKVLKKGDEGYVTPPKKGEEGYVRQPRKGEEGYIEKSKFGPTFQRIKSELEARGYNLQYKVLNTAKIANVPQHRERIYIVCLKDKSVADKFNLDFPSVQKATIESFLTKENVPDKYYYTEEKNNKISTRKPSVKKEDNEDEHDDDQENDADEEVDEDTDEEDDGSKIPVKSEKKTLWELVKTAVTKENTIYQYRRVYVRENKSNECPTLTANMGGGGHNVPLVKDKKGIRKLTPRECFQFQGFPSSYKLPTMTDSYLYKLAGNAVSVPVVKLIANRLIPLLEV